ncbi:MAG: hypothetical protein HY684_00765 [Chloroflexi bacterium]|nr:hypothetical protein [Chloroflexota bacterium]
MLRPVVFANAVAVVSAIGYGACALLSLAAPGLLVSIAQGWVHTLDLTKIQRPGFSFGEAFLGLIALLVTAWLGGWLLAWFYNRWGGAERKATTEQAHPAPAQPAGTHSGH